MYSQFVHLGNCGHCKEINQSNNSKPLIKADDKKSYEERKGRAVA